MTTTVPDGWEKHRREQLERTTTATPLQRIRWLEEAIAFAFRAGALPLQNDPSVVQPETSPELEPRVS